MGMLRVLLALTVLLTHAGGIGGYLDNTGPMAVQAFFTVSGFYMGLVLNERYNRPELNGVFYINRALRIFPGYFFFLALYLAVFAVVQFQTGTSPLWPYLTDTVSLPEKLFLGLLNVTIVGQDLSLFLSMGDGHLFWGGDPLNHQGAEVYRFMAIRVGWTLALEIYFYMLAPFVARRPAWQIAALIALSMAARIAAALMGVTADPFSYRFFPFEIAFFLLGVLSYKAWAAWPAFWETRRAGLLALAVPVVVLTYPLLLGDWPPNLFFTPVRIGTLLLIACAIPALHAWTRKWRFDKSVGELSYPLYLGHFLMAAFIPPVGLLAHSPVLHTVAIIAVSMAVSWLVVRFLDHGIETVRRRLAARAGAEAPAPSAKKGDDRSASFA